MLRHCDGTITSGWSFYLIRKELYSVGFSIDRKLPRKLLVWSGLLIHSDLLSTHLAELSKYPSDFILVGGPYLGGPVQDDAPMDMLGSVILVRASTREEALGELRKDIFARKAVWDFDQALVLPFKSTIRKGM